MSKLKDFNLYLITGKEYSRGRSNVEVVMAAIAGGVDIIQLREKNYTTRQLIKEGKELLKLTRNADIPLIINDRVDVALAIGADGVHLGQEDMSIIDARKIMGKNYFIGVSTSNLEQAKTAEKAGADYIGFGSVFATTTKVKRVVGTKALKKVTKAVKIPVVAIGGIKITNIEQVLKSGTNKIAIISGIVGARDIKDTAYNYKQQISLYNDNNKQES